MTFSFATLRTWAGLSAVAMALGVSCTSGAPDVALSPLATEGRDLARTSGCTACHGRNGEGGVAPSWKGLAGSTVTFTDATSVVVDRQYLLESITNPSALIREGYALKMPENSLSEEDAAKVVTYIEALR